MDKYWSRVICDPIDGPPLQISLAFYNHSITTVHSCHFVIMNE